VNVKATAKQLLTEAGVKEDRNFYGPFTGRKEKAALTVPQMIQAAWLANDAEAFAKVFVENGSLLMRDEQLTSRDQIFDHRSAGYRGGYKGARVTGWPLAVRFLSSDCAVVVTQGGIILPGETEIAPDRQIRATWVVVAEDGVWKLLSHHSSPIAGPAGVPAGSPETGSYSEENSMSNDAAQLVTMAKEWAGRYGKFSNGVEGAVLTVPLRVTAAWDSNDADAFAGVFTDNGSMLVGDEQLTTRDQIRDYMAGAFAGGWKGTRLADRPVEIRLISDNVAVAITQGGILLEGEDEVAPSRQTRTLWVTTKQDGEWRLVVRQTSPTAS
jgi:uncharacterized protein (TIGR02246 family)